MTSETADATLIGFASTIVDDPALARRLVEQALARAQDAGTDAERREAARVWVARAALSQDWTLGRPVAPDVDTPVGEPADGDDLPTRWSASSRLQRVVAALHFADHLDPASVARVVGSSEGDIATYLGGVRARLGLRTDEDDAALRRLLAARVTAAADDAVAAGRAELAETRARLDAAERLVLRAQDEAAAAARDTADAEQRQLEADRRADEADRRADEAERRASEAEVRVADADRRATEAGARVAEAEARAREAAAQAVGAEARAAEATAQATEAERRTAEAEAAAAEAHVRAAEADTRATEAEHQAGEAVARAQAREVETATQARREGEALAEAQARVAELDTELAGAREGRTALEARVTELAGALDSARTEIEAATADLDAARRDADTRAAELDAARRNAEDRIDELTAALDAARAEQAQHESGQVAAEEQRRVLDEQRAALEAELAAAVQARRDEVAALEQRLAQREAEVAELRASLTSVLADVDAAASELEARTSAFGAELTEVRAEVDRQLAQARKDATAALAAREDEHAAALAAARAESDALSERLRRAEADRDAATEQARRLEAARAAEQVVADQSDVELLEALEVAEIDDVLEVEDEPPAPAPSTAVVKADTTTVAENDDSPTAADAADRAAIDAEIDAMFELSVRKPPPYPSLKVVRPLILLTAVLGLNYLIWRWLFSIHWSAWFIAVPLVIAETYSLIDSLIFGFTMWRLKRRPDPGPPPEDATVDVFITTYNEPIDLVMKTAHAAQRITFPHTLWILDDGNRPELREIAGAEGIGVISRSSDWIDMPRHAKAGNLNNALMVTQGEFIVILDADQVPAPELLDRTLGYFREERMAVVQTPQFFVNVPRSDPLGSQAPLFYGPIQQGKDGWNSAFFCGSNAVLRREALLQMGIRRYVQELQVRIEDALSTSEKVIKRARAKLPASQKAIAEALTSVLDAARDARAEVADKEPLADITARFQRRVHEAARQVVEQDLAESRADLNELFELVDEQIAEVTSTDVQSEALDRLARRDWSPLGAIETVAALIAVVDVDREDEAQPIMPMSTISVTEDMATCMRMHSMGWKSAYHDEVLAVGLAPEDLGTMLTQRLRWAQGTIQVMLRENPLRQKGLSWPQKIMYLGTMWSYLSGFTALVYIAAPLIYLIFGVLPVQALSVSFFARLIPFLVVNQLLFFVIGRGRSTWRGQQYSLALFPVWIKAVTSAVSNVLFGRSLTFAVTPKERVSVEKLPWRLVRPQLIAMGLLVGAAVIGIIRLAAGQATVLGTTINLVWVTFDLVLFSAVIRALFYKGFEPATPQTAPAHSPAPTGAATLQEVSR